MNNPILSICIGYNTNNLFGCENDAILFFNLNFLYPKYILLGKKATIKNITKIFESNNTLTNIVIFFSGHGFTNGALKLYDKCLKPFELYEMINKNFIHPIKLYVILDCCYSGSFTQVKNFNKIINVFIISSCQNNETSTEIISIYNSDLFIERKPNNINKDNIVVGAFTINLVKLIKEKSLFNIDEWFLLKNELIWKELEDKIHQKINIKI